MYLYLIYQRILAGVLFGEMIWLCLLPFILLVMPPTVKSFGSGAPKESCYDLTPNHTVPAQTDDPPFDLRWENVSTELHPHWYDITLAIKAGQPTFKGFQIALKFDKDTDTPGTPLQGDFEVTPDMRALMKPEYCSGYDGIGRIPEGFFVTHKNASAYPDLESVHVLWQPHVTGIYKLKVTAVRTMEVFWTNISAPSIEIVIRPKPTEDDGSDQNCYEDCDDGSYILIASGFQTLVMLVIRQLLS